MAGHRIVYLGWVVVGVIATSLIEWLLTEFVSGFFMMLFFAIVLPMRLVMLHWLPKKRSWFDETILYLIVAPLMFVLFVGYKQIACEYELFLLEIRDYTKFVCPAERISNAYQVLGLSYLIGLWIMLLGVCNRLKPSAVESIQKWQARSLMIDFVGLIYGFGAIASIVIVLFVLVIPPSGLAVGLMLGIILPPLIAPFAGSVWKLFWASIMMCVFVVPLLLTPTWIGSCWFLLKFPWLVGLVGDKACLNASAFFGFSLYIIICFTVAAMISYTLQIFYRKRINFS